MASKSSKATASADGAITVRMTPELKEQFIKFCDSVGLSMSAAFTLFAKAVVREWRIPFDVIADPIGAERSANHE